MGEMKYSVENYKNKIIVFLNKSGSKPLPEKELMNKCRTKKGIPDNYKTALSQLIEEGVIFKRKRGFVLTVRMGYFPAVISRINRTFGFAKLEDGSEIFIPGKFLMGAMPDDRVLIRNIPSRSGSPEGEVIDILTENFSRFSGMVEMYEGRLAILPDTISKNHIMLSKSQDIPFKAGDKVLAELFFRGSRHSEHKAKVIMNFGSANSAANCAESLLAINGIETQFPADALNQAEKIEKRGIPAEDFKNRLDLRDEIIFTIDSASTKDIDDAVSLCKTDKYYILGVHIADVSHYVAGNSPLDKEALKRGTSVYYANKVVPMLPKELSNGICSLNPNEDRLAFSALMKLSLDGSLVDYAFKKTIIRSHVKGVYSEINSILDGSANKDILQKYDGLTDTISLMNELADILTANRIKRGAPSLETSESGLILNEYDVCVDVVPRERGKSEMIIEEFMLTANQAAAKTAMEKGIPFVYRIHENPSPERIENLTSVLEKLNIEYPHFTEIKPSHMSEILKNSKDKESFPIINVLLLRAMSKAKYSPEPVGHFGLALDDYAHFTSPIRRYPDLAIHRILSSLVNGGDVEWLKKRYTAFVQNASERSTAAEIRAMTAERQCDDCYKAEYMSAHIGEEFDGIISSATEYGFYVELKNTVEGLVHINSLPDGNYSFDGSVSLTEELSQKTYTVGDTVRVVCAKADVNSGNIDFSLV